MTPTAETAGSIDHIMRAVKSRLSDMGSHEDYRLQRVIERSYSNIAIIEPISSGQSGRKLVVKTIKHHPINESITKKENQAVVEYEILTQLYPHFKEVKGCAVPRPIMVIPEMELYVMQFVEGDLLLDANIYLRYGSSLRKFKELKEMYLCCGRWLRIFQEVTGIEKYTGDVFADIAERCDQRLSLIEQSKHPAIPNGFRGQILSTISNYIEQLSDCEIPVAGRHGDFGPWNILYNSEGITVLDFLGFQKDPLPVDLLKFLMFLHNEKMSITSSGRRVKHLRDSFVEGYGSLPDMPEAIILLCEILQRVVSLWLDVAWPGKLLHQKIESSRRIHQSLKWLNNPTKSCLWLSH